MKTYRNPIGPWTSLGAVLAGLLCVGGLRAQPTSPVAPKKVEEKTAILFEMRARPWANVFEWLSDQTGLPFISNYAPPTGTFQFIAPKIGTEQRRYTMPQIIDIINEALLAHKYTLIRREASLTLVPADEKIDPNLVPRILPADLDNRGATEIVSVVLPLQMLVAEDFAPEVKKLMGPFGEVVALSKANQLVMQDNAGNLRRILATVKKIESDESGQAETFSHKCLYIRAGAAEKLLKDFLGDPRQLVVEVRGRDPRDQRGGDPRDPRNAQGSSSTRVRMYYVTSDDRTNTVHVNGPPDKIAQAKSVLAKVDVPQPGQPPIAVGPPTLQTYAVPQGNADALAKTLQEIYKSSATLRISAVGTGQIMVWGGPEEQIEIARHIQGTRPAPATTELIGLTVLDAVRLSETLKAMFGDAKTGAPYIEADLTRNAIVVKGSPEQVKEVKSVIAAIGDNPATANSKVRIISLDKGSAATLAEALQRLLPQMRANPVKVVLPGSGGLIPNPEPAPQPKKAEPPRPTFPRKDVRSLRPGPEYVAAEAQPPFDPAKKAAGEEGKGPAKGAPITITAFGNKLIVTSEDPEALALVSELVRLLTQTPGGEGDFEVIHLKHANAVDAARILDEAFNGPKQEGGGGRGGRGGGGPPGGGLIPGLSGGVGGLVGSFLGIGGGATSGGRVERIRVVADQDTNSLLVKATPLDLLTIRNLLAKAIDTGTTDSNAVPRTWLIGPLKNAAAPEVATILRDVYREAMTARTSNTGGSNRFPFPFGGGGGRTDNRADDKDAALSVGIDEKTNSLILSCSTILYEDIKHLVEELDRAAGDAKQSIKIVNIKGIDPSLVQQAIDAIQGRPTARTSSGSTGFSPIRGGSDGGNSGSRFPGGGFPGMTPGGFPGIFPGGGSGIPSRGGPTGRGGRTGGRGGRGMSSSLDPGGPDFFVERVTDDPRNDSSLFDPRREQPLVVPAAVRPFIHTPRERIPDGLSLTPPLPASFVPASFVAAYGGEDKGKKTEPGKKSATKDAPKVDIETFETPVPAPRLPVDIEALQQLGVIILRANNPQDLEAALRIIQFLQDAAKGAEVEVRIVPLKQGDATSVVNILNQLYQRVVIGPNSTTQVTGPQRPIVAGGGQGQQPVIAQPTPTAVNVVMIPLPRQNAILLAAPSARMKDIEKEIARLDQPTAPEGRATPFALKRQSASRVANLITQFFADRYPNESRAQHQVRVTWDDNTNTVFVQAAPADLTEIRALVERIDTMPSLAVNDLRIFRLNNAVSDDLAILLTRAITDGFAPTTTTGLGGLGGAGQLPGQPGGAGQPGGGLGLGQGLGQGLIGQTGLAGQGLGTRATKVSSLRFVTGKKDGKAVQTGILEDVRITSDPRTNSLLISAPEKTMLLLQALVKELDVPPAARSEINIFPLRKGDAVQVAQTLQQLFLGTGGLGTTTQTGGGFPGGGGALGQAGGGLLGAQLGQPRPLQLTLRGTSPEGAPLIDLRLTVDERTNSLIVAGSRNDLEIIEAVIGRLEDADVQQRRNFAYKLQNALAADVAVALNDFLTKSLTVLQGGNQLNAFQKLQKEVVLVPEPISNSVLISATQDYFDDIMALVRQLDAMPPQVVIQVLVAEVDLSDNNEFGVEIGLQSPVLFQRGIFPAAGFDGTTSFTAPTDGSVGLVPPGVTVNNTVNPSAYPGFNFNTTNPLGNNPAASSKLVGFQGLGNLGVGRISPTSNVGGFVFSAASESFNLLIRALKVQSRLDIMARPQIMTLDGQTAFINVGQEIPIVTSTTATATGFVQSNIDRRQVGVLLQVTPKIMPDGRVLMRVIPEISSVVPQPVNLGNGQVGTALNLQRIETTVSAYDGETVALGGLITTRASKQENKIPWLGDLPGVGAAFRFRTHQKAKVELLIIMTPHVVRNRAEAERILAEESRKMDWILGDLYKIHGNSASGPLSGAHPYDLPPAAAPEQGPAPQPVLPPGAKVISRGFLRSSSPNFVPLPADMVEPATFGKTAATGAAPVGFTMNPAAYMRPAGQGKDLVQAPPPAVSSKVVVERPSLPAPAELPLGPLPGGTEAQDVPVTTNPRYDPDQVDRTLRSVTDWTKGIPLPEPYQTGSGAASVPSGPAAPASAPPVRPMPRREPPAPERAPVRVFPSLPPQGPPSNPGSAVDNQGRGAMPWTPSR